ncbi:MAG TPA: MFS transporter [Steroidobacteraceae bacterium]|jgi:ACS family tartrate transporter-like MFS transporter|nr:MFS transporter [Steroidobacteraceae bacterium]
MTGRVARRLIPFLMLCYVLSYIGRIDVNLAWPAMSKALGLPMSSSSLGAAVGAFSLMLVLFAVPSVVLLKLIGARRWVAASMIALGVISVGFAFTRELTLALRATGFANIDNDRTQYILRLLLGAAVAGILPGIVLYLANWSTASERARYVGSFIATIPLSAALFPAVSALLTSIIAVCDSKPDSGGWWMQLVYVCSGGVGWSGWQWMLIIAALPSIAVGIAALRYLQDSPCEAYWLNADERASLAARLEEDRNIRRQPLRRTIANWIVLFFCVGWLPLLLVLLLPVHWRRGLSRFARTLILGAVLAAISFAGASLGVPLHMNTRSAVLSLGLDHSLGLAVDKLTGYLTSVVFALAFAAAFFWSLHGGRAAGEPRHHAALAAVVAALGLIAAASSQAPIWIALLIALGMIASFAAMAMFWTLPAGFLAGWPAVLGISFISSLGTMGGVLGPAFITSRGASGGQSGLAGALIIVACCYLFAGLMILALGRDHDRKPSLEPTPAPAVSEGSAAAPSSA